MGVRQAGVMLYRVYVELVESYSVLYVIFRIVFTSCKRYDEIGFSHVGRIFVRNVGGMLECVYVILEVLW